MYGPGARERIELEHLEREKREREIRELRERELNDRLKEEIMKSGMRGPPNPMDPHWLEIQRRYAAAGLAGPSGKLISMQASPRLRGHPKRTFHFLRGLMNMGKVGGCLKFWILYKENGVVKKLSN